MSSYILVDGTITQNNWWKELVLACAVVGDVFEIHCWSDEIREARLALQFGHRVTSTWHDGTVIMGTITREFLTYLTEMPKPVDTQIYNKMTPFFTIQLGSYLSSEHYGTEIILSKVPQEKQPYVERILRELEACATVHRNIR